MESQPQNLEFRNNPEIFYSNWSILTKGLVPYTKMWDSKSILAFNGFQIVSMGESFQDYSWIQDFEADFP